MLAAAVPIKALEHQRLVIVAVAYRLQTNTKNKLPLNTVQLTPHFCFSLCAKVALPHFTLFFVSGGIMQNVTEINHMKMYILK